MLVTLFTSLREHVSRDSSFTLTLTTFDFLGFREKWRVINVPQFPGVPYPGNAVWTIRDVTAAFTAIAGY